METTWNGILWNQYGASIDMLENAIDACPDELWSDLSKPPAWASHGVVGFWYLVYHTLFFLDLIISEPEKFVPPPPFDLRELDPAGLLPDRPYTKEELGAYLRQCRQKCRQALASLTEEAIWRPRRYGTMELPYAELLLYNLRHVQHHAGQLHLLLRQNVGAAPRWVRQARVAG